MSYRLQAKVRLLYKVKQGEFTSPPSSIPRIRNLALGLEKLECHTGYKPKGSKNLALGFNFLQNWRIKSLCSVQVLGVLQHKKKPN
jgi:hypothetical protein